MTLFGSRKVSAGNGGSGGHAYAYSFGGGGDAKGGGYRWSKIKLIEFLNPKLIIILSGDSGPALLGLWWGEMKGRNPPRLRRLHPPDKTAADTMWWKPTEGEKYKITFLKNNEISPLWPGTPCPTPPTASAATKTEGSAGGGTGGKGSGVPKGS